jgi:hypothetical protein
MDCTDAPQNASCVRDHTLRMSRVEELQTQYAGRWEIYRELQHHGSHGPWIARRLTGVASGEPELCTWDIELLADRLAVAEA